MKDNEELIKAMMFLEMVDEQVCKEDVETLVIAAHYLIQSYATGVKPDDFDECIDMAESFVYNDQVSD